MYRCKVSICKKAVELNVPYDTFFPSAIPDAAYRNEFVRLLSVRFEKQTCTRESPDYDHGQCVAESNLTKMMMTTLDGLDLVRVAWICIKVRMNKMIR